MSNEPDTAAITAEHVIETVATNRRGSQAAVERFAPHLGERFTNCGLTQLGFLLDPDHPAMVVFLRECVRRRHFTPVRPGTRLSDELAVLREAATSGAHPFNSLNYRNSVVPHLAELPRDSGPFEEIVRRFVRKSLAALSGA